MFTIATQAKNERTRWALAGGVAVIVTVALFLIMYSLVAGQRYELEEADLVPSIDFIRADDESDLQSKIRKPPAPPKKQEEEPPPPPLDLSKIRKPLDANNLNTTAISTGLDIGGKGLQGQSDGDILPIVRVPPQYPTRALSRGIEGWVLLEFSISPTGTVMDPVVIDAEPTSIFNRAAIRAVTKWKYKPRIEAGKPVVRQGVQTVITFELDE